MTGACLRVGGVNAETEALRVQEPRPPRVAVVHWGSTGGGPLFHLHLAGAVAVAAPHRTVVCSSASSDQRARYAVLQVPHQSVDLPSDLPRSPRGWLGVIRAVARVRRFLQRQHVDVVVIAMESPHLFLLAPFLRGRRRRVVFGLHDPDFHPGERSMVKVAARFMTIASSDGLLTWSHAAEVVLRKKLQSSKMACFSTVHGAYGRPAAQPRTLDANARVTLGFFGRIQPYKGVGMLLSAFQELSAATVDKYRLVIYGEGELPVDPDPATIGDVELYNRWIADSEVPSLLRGIDIMVLPYLEASQSGVLALALAAGVPSVATPVGGLREQIEDSGAGVVAEAVSPGALADAVQRLAMNPDGYRSLSAAALNSAAGAYSWERVAVDVDAVARSVHSRPAASLLTRLRAATLLSRRRPT